MTPRADNAKQTASTVTRLSAGSVSTAQQEFILSPLNDITRLEVTMFAMISVAGLVVQICLEPMLMQCPHFDFLKKRIMIMISVT